MLKINIEKFIKFFPNFYIYHFIVIVRIIMGEALLATPVLGSFVVMEFIMTMGANDF